MSDYQSHFTGAQIDTILGAANKELMTPGAEDYNNQTFFGMRFGGFVTSADSPSHPQAKVFYIAKTPGTYAGFSNLVLVPGEVVIITFNGTNWTKSSLATSNVRYVECTTDGGFATKNVDITGFHLGTDIRLLIKMSAVNTVDNVNLSVNGSDVHPLYYKGNRAGDSNTWKQDEVLDVYFDGFHYQARAGVSVVQSTGQDPDVVMSQKAVTDELTVIKQEIWPLEITFTNDASNPAEYTGNNINVTLSWTCKRKGVNKIPELVVIKKGSTVLQTLTPSAASGTYATTVNELGNIAFTVEITADGMTKTATTTVSTVLASYVGFFTHGSSADANTMKSSLTKKVVKSVSSLTGTYSNDQNGKDLVILVPATMTVNNITSSGFGVPYTLVNSNDTSITIGGTARSYKVYKSSSSTGINAGNMSIVVS